MTRAGVVKYAARFADDPLPNFAPNQFIYCYNDYFKALTEYTSSYDVNTGRTSVFLDHLGKSVFKVPSYYPSLEASVFKVDVSGSSVDGMSLANLLKTALGADILGSYIPYLLPQPLPLVSELKTVNNVSAPIVLPYSTGQAAYAICDTAGSLNYRGHADITGIGLFYLDSEGYPNLGSPYLLEIRDQLDVPTSQLSSQIVSAISAQTTALISGLTPTPPISGFALESTLQQIKTKFDQSVSAQTVDIVSSNAASAATIVSSVDTQTAALTASIAAQTVALLAGISPPSGLATEATLVQCRNLLSSIESYTHATVTAIQAMNTSHAQLLDKIASALYYAPPKALDTVSHTKTVYPPMALAEGMYRALYTTQPLNIIDGVVSFINVPVSSTLCPVNAEPSGINYAAPYAQPGNPSILIPESVQVAFNPFPAGQDPFVDYTSFSISGQRAPCGALSNAVITR